MDRWRKSAAGLREIRITKPTQDDGHFRSLTGLGAIIIQHVTAIFELQACKGIKAMVQHNVVSIPLNLLFHASLFTHSPNHVTNSSSIQHSISLG